MRAKITPKHSRPAKNAPHPRKMQHPCTLTQKPLPVLMVRYTTTLPSCQITLRRKLIEKQPPVPIVCACAQCTVNVGDQLGSKSCDCPCEPHERPLHKIIYILISFIEAFTIYSVPYPIKTQPEDASAARKR